MRQVEICTYGKVCTDGVGSNFAGFLMDEGLREAETANRREGSDERRAEWAFQPTAAEALQSAQDDA